MIVTNSD